MLTMESLLSGRFGILEQNRTGQVEPAQKLWQSHQVPGESQKPRKCGGTCGIQASHEPPEQRLLTYSHGKDSKVGRWSLNILKRDILTPGKGTEGTHLVGGPHLSVAFSPYKVKCKAERIGVWG